MGNKIKFYLNILKQSRLLPPVLLAIIVILFFWPVVTLRSFPYSTDFSSSDLTEINLPFKYVLKQSLAEGRIPWWVDGISSGYPLAAESQIGFFYPLNLIFFGSLPLVAAFNWILIFHIFWAALGFYLYMRLLGVGKWGALFTAMAVSLGTAFTFRLKYLNLITALSWLPWALLLAEKFRQKRNFVYAALAGVVFALQILAGHGQMAFVTIVFLAIYLFFSVLFSVGRKWPGLFFVFLFFAVAGIISLGLSAVQILPARELVEYSWRAGGMSFLDATVSSFHPRNILNLFWPFFWGNPAKGTFIYQPMEIIEWWGIFWETAVYSGLLTIFLSAAVWWMILRKKKENAPIFPYLKIIYIFAGVGLVGVLLALGKFVIFYQWLFEFVPGFAYFRVPSRFIVFLAIAVAVWAGIGLDIFYKYLQNKKGRRLANLAAFVLLFLLIGDLYWVNKNYTAYIDAAGWLSPPEVVSYLQGEKNSFRLTSLDEEYSFFVWLLQARGWWYDQKIFVNNRNIMSPNSQLLWDFQAEDDLFALKFKRHWRLLAVSKELGIRPFYVDFPKENRIQLTDGYQKVLGLQNIKYILTFFNITNLPQVGQVDFDNLMLPLRVYLNPYFVPRAYLVFAWEGFSTDNSLEKDKYLIKRMMADDFLPGQTAIVEGKDVPAWQRQAEPRGDVKINKWHNGYIELQAEADKPALLVVSNSYYPGWQARVDGQLVEIVRANYIYQGIFLPAGKHRIELVYQPTYGRVGMVISLSTFALLVGGVVFWVVIRLRRSLE